jgi:hypothetical protein
MEEHMTRDEVRGQDILNTLPKYTHPKPIFVPKDGHERLYKLEEKRNAAMVELIKEWLKVTDLEDDKYWTVAAPQVLHDALENWDLNASVVAAEAFLIRHGWKIERPEPILDA